MYTWLKGRKETENRKKENRDLRRKERYGDERRKTRTVRQRKIETENLEERKEN